MIGIFGKLRNLISVLPRSRIIFLLGGLVLLLAIPLTVIVSQQQQKTKQHASGFEENIASIAQDVSQDSNQISSNPKGCGDKCAEEPPVPSGIITINYCSQPLTIPSSEVTGEYKSYQNVKNNKDKKDNRYFVYVSKDNADPVKIKVSDIDDVTVEQLVGDSVSFDGENLTVAGSGAFAIHANPERESAIGPCILGAFCSYKDLSLKAGGAKSRIYPSDNCAQLSASISYMAAKKSIDGDGGTGKGLLYAAMNKVVDKVFEAQANIIEKAAQPSSLVSATAPAPEKVTISIDMQMGADPAPLVEGAEYMKVTFTKGEAVKPALEFARGLRNLPTPEDKITAINKWIAENGVYPTEEVIKQLIREGDIDLATFASRFYEQAPGSTEKVFSASEETLDNVMGTKLSDGRFMCMCRDVAVLGVAMAQEAGVEAYPVEGIAGFKALRDLEPESHLARHAWVEFKNSQGKIVGWDPTDALSDDLTTPPKIYKLPETSANFPNDFRYGKKLKIPVFLLNDFDNVVFRLTDADGRTIPYKTITFPEGRQEVYIEGYKPDEQHLTYKLEIDISNEDRIIRLKMQAPDYYSEISSSTLSVPTSSDLPAIPVIINDGKKLIVVHPELLPKTTLDGLRTYNEAKAKFLRNPPNTPAELMRTQKNALGDLKLMIETFGNQSEEVARALITNPMIEVKQLMDKLNLEQKMAVISDTLAIAENSPLQGKGMMSLASLKTNRTKFFAKGVGVGTEMANLLGGPITADLGNYLDNAYLITASRVTNTFGMGQMVMMGGKTVAQAAVAANVAFKGASGALAVRTAVGGVAAGAAIGGTAVALAGQTAITAVGISFATTLYCGMNPTSSMCGCRISGEYGENKLILELQKYDASKGEKIKYRILGFENCPTHVGLEAVSGMINLANARAPEPKLTTGKDGNARNPIGGEGTQCKWQPDGRWCLGEFAADLDKGSYKLTILQPQILVGQQNPLYLYPHDTGQMLNVDGGGSASVKLVPSLTPTPKIGLSPSPTASILSPFSAYNQCLVICDQGTLIAQDFDKTACMQSCDIKFKQFPPATITPVPTVIRTPKITTAPISISPTVSVSPVIAKPTATPFPTVVPLSSSPIPTPTSIPQASCPLSLTKADANCDGRIDMNDFNKQRDYAIGGQMTEEQLTLWVSSVWSPAFSNQ